MGTLIMNKYPAISKEIIKEHGISKDEYSKLVYKGQDISEDQRYKFNVSGTI
mgnify:CR=1 FL=1